MRKLFILSFAIIMSCGSISKKTIDKVEEKAEIIISESQGGSGKMSFFILKNEQEFQKATSFSNNVIVELGAENVSKPIFSFPKDKKVVLYNLGDFRSGDHKIKEIKKAYVENNILYLEVPYVERGDMEIQVLSKPYIVFTVPSSYNFSSIELKSIK